MVPVRVSGRLDTHLDGESGTATREEKSRGRVKIIRTGGEDEVCAFVCMCDVCVCTCVMCVGCLCMCVMCVVYMCVVCVCVCGMCGLWSQDRESAGELPLGPGGGTGWLPLPLVSLFSMA